MLDESVGYAGHSHLYRDRGEVGPVPCLAICRDLRDGKTLLMHCDQNWNVLGVAAYDSVLIAKERAEHIYPGVSNCWRESHVTEQELSAYLDTLWSNQQCSFCGKRPYQVEKFIEKDGKHICDECIAELYKALQKSPKPGE